MKVPSGLRIAVTRARSQAEELAEPLRAAGAEVSICPLIKIEPLPVGVLPDADWVVLTSTNGVDLFLEAIDHTRLERVRFACVGPATAARLQQLGFNAEVVPYEHTGEAIAREMAARLDLQGVKVLLARASGGGEALPHELRERGAIVYEAELYRSVADLDGAKSLHDAILSGKIDLITFTSGSTIRYFVESVPFPSDTTIAVIGPSTAQVARSYGLRVDIAADPHTIAGLVQAIAKFYGGLNAGK